MTEGNGGKRKKLIVLGLVAALILSVLMPALGAIVTDSPNNQDAPTITIVTTGVDGKYVEVGLNVNSKETGFRSVGAVLRYDSTLLAPVNWAEEPVAVTDDTLLTGQTDGRAKWIHAVPLETKGPDDLSGKTALAYREKVGDAYLGYLYLNAEAPSKQTLVQGPLPTASGTSGTTVNGVPYESVSTVTEAVPQAVTVRLQLKSGADLTAAINSVDIQKDTETTTVAKDSPVYDDSGVVYFNGQQGVSTEVNLQMVRVTSGETCFTGGENAVSVRWMWNYDARDNTYVETLVKKNDAPVPPAVPARENYVFDGWYSARSDGTPLDEAAGLTENTVLFAHWVALHSITWNWNNGTSPSTTVVKVKHGDGLSEAPDVYRTGYTFLGWARSSTATAPDTGDNAILPLSNVTGDATYYAVWRQNTEVPVYTITWNHMDGPNSAMVYDGANTTVTTVVANGTEPVVIPVVKRDGYILKGWSKSLTGNVPVTNAYVPTGNETFYAIWTEDTGGSDSANVYSIKWNHMDGDTSSPQTNASVTTTTVLQSAGKVGFFPAVSRSGYTLQGWATEPNATAPNVTADTPIAADNTTFYAVWTQAGSSGGSAEVHAVTWDWNDKDGTGNTKTYTVVVAGQAVTPQLATRDGYILRGWNTQADGQGTPVTETTVPDRDETYYAQWLAPGDPAGGGTEDLLAKVYTVTWNHCDGTEDQTDPSKGAATSLSTVVAGGTIGVVPTVSREGYVLKGWTDDPADTADESAAIKAAKPTGNVTYYALWAKQHTITWNWNDKADKTGESPADTTSESIVEAGDPLTVLSWATRAGHTLDGWYTEATGGDKIDETTVPVGDVIYYAHWTEGGGSGSANVYKVHWNLCDGDGEGKEDTILTTTVEVTDGVAEKAIPPSVTAPSGKMLTEWNSLDNGEGTSYAVNAQDEEHLLTPTEETTLYAIWDNEGPVEADPSGYATIVFRDWDETLIGSAVVPKGDASTAVAEFTAANKAAEGEVSEDTSSNTYHWLAGKVLSSHKGYDFDTWVLDKEQYWTANTEPATEGVAVFSNVQENMTVKASYVANAALNKRTNGSSNVQYTISSPIYNRYGTAAASTGVYSMKLTITRENQDGFGVTRLKEPAIRVLLLPDLTGAIPFYSVLNMDGKDSQEIEIIVSKQIRQAQYFVIDKYGESNLTNGSINKSAATNATKKKNVGVNVSKDQIGTEGFVRDGTIGFINDQCIRMINGQSNYWAGQVNAQAFVDAGLTDTLGTAVASSTVNGLALNNTSNVATLRNLIEQAVRANGNQPLTYAEMRTALGLN